MIHIRVPAVEHVYGKRIFRERIQRKNTKMEHMTACCSFRCLAYLGKDQKKMCIIETSRE